MEYDKKLLQDVKDLVVSKYPRFGAIIARISLEYKTDLKYHTAATDGNIVYFDPDFLASLNNSDKLFIIAHELMHIMFGHTHRIKDKNGKERDLDIWNIATDAIINANLERDGFKIKEGYVNMPEALNYNSEELYEKLLREKQEQQQEFGNNGEQENTQQQSENSQNQGQNEKPQQEQGASSGKQFADDHSLWGKTPEESQEQGNGKNKELTKNDQSNQSQTSKNGQSDHIAKISKFSSSQFDERNEFQENRKDRFERAKQKMKNMRDQGLKKLEKKDIKFGKIGEEKPILDWKLLLRREVEKTEIIWSQRKSIAENNYAYRLEENDVEDEAETEVMIDVSGSISLNMIKSFLRQLKPILRESKLKIGFFSDYATKKFLSIEKEKDIDNLKLPFYGGGTNIDASVRAFSKKRENNKIVFTDGYCDDEVMPKKDLKNVNCIWIVYENKEFSPCCGKVINIELKDLQNMINAERDLQEYEFSM